MTFPRFNSIALVAVVLFLFAEISLLFFTPRSETLQLLVVYAAMCLAYLVLYHEIRDIKSAAFLAIFFRGIAWFAFPNLSDDVYRFIWDGAQILEGVNPFTLTPTAFFAENNHPPFNQLYPLLNSPNYYSVYPTVIQLISGFGALASNDFYLASLLIKLPLFLAEIGTIWILPKVLLNFSISPKYSVLYFLNPLLIVDVLGNAHFEAIMVFLVVLTFKFLQSKKYSLAGAAMAMSVGTKLIPLLLVPFLFKALSSQARRKFGLSFAGLSVLLFLPFFEPKILANFSQSIDLYIRTFEFNAGIYYVIRYLAMAVTGENLIRFIGPFMALSVILIGMVLLYKQRPHSLLAGIRSGFWLVVLYYLLATTVHPWYVAFPVILGIFTRRRFPVIWSMLIFLSYSAYGNEPTSEIPWLLIIEYFVLYLAIAYPKFTRKLTRQALNKS